MSGLDPDPTLLALQIDANAALAMFWFLLLFDLPRYTLALITVIAAEFWSRPPLPSPDGGPVVTILIVGHNEGGVLDRCVRSLREQTYDNQQIICVDDGSTDNMAAEMRRLRAAGLIDVALSTNLRCGKSSGFNLGLTHARGAIVINVDADCTFDRDAIANIIAPFADPRVGAVSGNIGARNADATLIASLQALEYLLSISLGKRILDTFGIVTCASGAFGAFRRTALQTIGGLELGPGEDLDLTLRLRNAGWRIRFAENAWCATEVPASLGGLIRQRLRWDRDALRLRLRKHRSTIDPRNRRLVFSELIQQMEFLLFTVVLTLVFPIYVGVLIAWFGAAALPVLVLVTIAYVILDGIAVLVSLALIERPGLARLLPCIPIFGLYNGLLLRSVRLYAFAQEWMFHASRLDDYVPARVRRGAPWY